MTAAELIAWARACRKQGFHTNLGLIADALEAAITPNPASVIGIKVTEIEAEDQRWLSDNPNTSDIVEWIKTYARNEVAIAIAKQAAQLETAGWLHTFPDGTFHFSKVDPINHDSQELADAEVVITKLYATAQSVNQETPNV